MGHDPLLDELMDPAVAHQRKRTIAVIEAIAMEQLSEYGDELSLGQRKVISDQIAREAWRRLNQDLQEPVNT